ncbi:Importin subunit alpha-8 [Hondaea fermentalgiana]|uniref:Vacuolar protein 8 n=1 Tax=Hondaea fermentalgiana TaxID=2315210 RepID=A0A2R5FYS1_9STRA|nr:Importin subunit alpha-8 [Hondaea fermentalgiana]|eukprot:GBG23902.1 Importin subunit alpha-8 [Hondaea fermentalgiana]
MPKIFVELSGSQELNVLPRRNLGVVALEKQEFEAVRTVADLRKHIDDFLGDKVTRGFVFFHDQTLVPVAQEGTLEVAHVMKRRNKNPLFNQGEYKVTIKMRSTLRPVQPQAPPLLQELRRKNHAKFARSREPIMSFAASSYFAPKGTTGTQSAETGLVSPDAEQGQSKQKPTKNAPTNGTDTATLSGFLRVLEVTRRYHSDDDEYQNQDSVEENDDIDDDENNDDGPHVRRGTFGDKRGGTKVSGVATTGRFERFFCKLENNNSLFAFGPCSERAVAADFAGLSNTSATHRINLASIFKIQPYKGSRPSPPRHFIMEILAEEGAIDCVLAVPSVVEFAAWVRAFHQASPHLRGLQYNINHEMFTWSISALHEDAFGGAVKSASKTRNGGGDDDRDIDNDDLDGLKKQMSQTRRIRVFKIVSIHNNDTGFTIVDCADGAMVGEVIMPALLADPNGVATGDILVAIGDIPVFGKPADEVKRILAKAVRPVCVTTGTPNDPRVEIEADARGRTTSLASSSSEQSESSESSVPSRPTLKALAWRRRLGPFLYDRSNEKTPEVRPLSSATQLSVQDESCSTTSITDAEESVTRGSGAQSRHTRSLESGTFADVGLDGGAPPGLGAPGFPQMRKYTPSGREIPLAPPRTAVDKKPSRLFASLKGRRPPPPTTLSLEESDQSNASRAASRQLSRFKGLQSRLFSAIQTSYALEERIDEAIENLVREAENEARCTGIADEASVGTIKTRKARGLGRVTSPPPVPPPLTPPPVPPLEGATQTSRGPSLVLHNAVSSRLQSTRYPENRVARLQRMLSPNEFSDRASVDFSSNTFGSEVVETVESSYGRAPIAAQPGEQPPKPCGLGLYARAVSHLLWARNALALRLDPTQEKLHRLVNLARSNDAEDREDALEAILDMATSSKNVKTLVQDGIIDVLVDSLRSKESVAIRENAAGVLWNLSDDPDAAEAIVSSGAIPYLLRLLRHPADDRLSSDVAKEEAAGALWTLADLPSGRAEILLHRGVKPIVYNLSEEGDATDFTQENLMGVIWHLSFEPEAVVEIMKRRKRIVIVAEMARLITHGTSVAQENAAGALMHISYAPQYRPLIKSCAEAIPALVQLLAFGSILSRENACGALNNLALGDEATQQLIADEGAIPPLVRLLQPHFSPAVRVRVALCLRNLAQNRDVKDEIIEAGATDALIRALKERDALVQIHSTEALWALAHESDANKVAIGNSEALPRLVRLLRNSNETARARAAGALGSLTEVSENLPRIGHSGALEPLIEMLREGDPTSRREAAAALGNLTMGPHDVQRKVVNSLKRDLPDDGEDATDDLEAVRSFLVEIEVRALPNAM